MLSYAEGLYLFKHLTSEPPTSLVLLELGECNAWKRMLRKWLETDATVLPSDVIIVLGAAVWQGGRPSPALRRRVLYAVDLFNQGKGRQLLLTGGVGRHPPSEAEVMRHVALVAGVSLGCLVLEEQGTSTFSSAIYCHHMMRQHGWSSALIVTDRYHLPRAQLTFRQLAGGPGIAITGRGVGARRRIWSLQLWLRTYGREWAALVWYLPKIIGWKIGQYLRS